MSEIVMKWFKSQNRSVRWLWAFGLAVAITILFGGNYAVAQFKIEPVKEAQILAQVQTPTPALKKDLQPLEGVRPIAGQIEDAVEGSPQDMQIQATSFRGHCWCRYSCTSSCGGSLDQSTHTVGGLLWQHLETNRLTCKNRCDNLIDDAVNAWSVKGQISCTGTSWVGTNTNKAKPVSYSTNKGACEGGPGSDPATACCPPIQKGQVSPLFERLAGGPPSAPFGLAYKGSAASIAASLTFDQKMVASATLGALNGGCSPITVTHTLRNMSASGTPIVATLTVTYMPSGASAPVSTGSWTGLSINTTYKVMTTVACPANVINYYASTCPQRSFDIAWIFGPETRMAPSASVPPTAARVQVRELN